MTEGRTGLRLKVLAGLVAFMFAALTTRLWFLQVLASERYRSEASQNAVRLVETPAPRGRILDAQGNVLVENRMSLVVTINRQELGDQAEGVLFRLSQVLGVSVKTLVGRLQDPRYYSFSPVPVAVDVPKNVAFYIGEHQDEFPGVSIVKTPVRTYPEGSLAAHVLGYLGQISEEQLKDPGFAGYGQNDLVGVTGVEAVYEHELRGTKGVVKYRVNANGKNLGEIGSRPPAPGDDLVLTLDTGVQRLAEQSLALGEEYARGLVDPSSATGAHYAANAGAVIVMDPQTGAILALASSPSYDPSVFGRGLTQAEYNRQFGTKSSGYPLVDRAIAGQYPPGSTFKPFIALSALKRGFVSETGSYPCPPTYQVPGDPHHQIFNNWTTSNLGYLSLASALSISCDTVFYPLGYDYWRVYYPPTDPPHEPLQQDLRSMGFGQPPGIDLPAEQDGRIPDALWKAQIHKQYPTLFPDGQWFPGDFVNMSIGQGDTLVTPLQLADAFAAIANGGHLCVPHLGLRIQRPEGTVVRRIRPHCDRRVSFAPAQLAFIRQALTDVPITGTAAEAFIGFPFSRVSVAGKTGTAQVPRKQDFSWFAAMTSGAGKRYVIVALVEQAGHGSTTAAPIVRRIIEGLYGIPTTQFINVAGTD